MPRTLLALTTTASAALAGLLIAAAPAAASAEATTVQTATGQTTTVPATTATGPGAPAAAGRGTRLAISVRPARGPVKVAWLTCDPAGGSHRRAAEACAALTAAGGDPAAITPEDTMCTMEHAPVRATVTGLWERRPIRFQQTYSNACVMRVATRDLFRVK